MVGIGIAACNPRVSLKDQEQDMDTQNSMEERFVDRLLHALAAMGQYDGQPAAPATVLPRSERDPAVTPPYNH